MLINISPYILENYIMKVFPFLSQSLGRAGLYVIVSSFCFGSELGILGKFNGFSMLVCAGLAVYVYAFSPVIPPNTGAQPYYHDEI